MFWGQKNRINPPATAFAKTTAAGRPHARSLAFSRFPANTEAPTDKNSQPITDGGVKVDWAEPSKRFLRSSSSRSRLCYFCWSLGLLSLFLSLCLSSARLDRAVPEQAHTRVRNNLKSRSTYFT